MILTYDEIKSITFGCQDIRKEKDGIHFLRHTEKQTDVFYKMRPFWGDNSRDTAGVMLDFYTDSERLVFEVSAGIKFEVLVNGLLCSDIRFSDAPYKLEHKNYAEAILGEKNVRKRVTLVFPVRGFGVLNTLKLDDGSEVTPYNYSGKILFLGDSIVQGWCCGKNAYSYSHIVSRRFDSEMLNLGVGGFYYDSVSLDGIKYDPDRIIVSYGANDYDMFGASEQFKENVYEYMQRLKSIYPDKKIYVITPIWLPVVETDNNTALDECRNIISDTASRFGFCVIDGKKLFPRDIYLFADEAHLNLEGNKKYAENLIAEIEALENNV